MRTHIMTTSLVATALVVALAGCAPTWQSGTSHIGDTVKITGTLTGPSADAFKAAFADFTDETGITVDYVGSDTFATDIVADIQAAAAPDIALVGNHGTLADIVATGDAVALASDVSNTVAEAWNPQIAATGSVADVSYAVPLTTHVQNYVFYSPERLAEWGVEVPQTWQEVLTATERIHEQTHTPPWCLGYAAPNAQASSSWISGALLRGSGEDAYREWARGDLSFSAPAATSAFTMAAGVLRDADAVNGNFGVPASIATTTADQALQALIAQNCAFVLGDSATIVRLSGAKTSAGDDVTFGPDQALYAFALPGVHAGDVAAVSDGETEVLETPEPSETPAVTETPASPAPTGTPVVPSVSATPTATPTAPEVPEHTPAVLPFEVSVTSALALNTAGATTQVMAYLASEKFAQAFVAAGEVSARAGVDPDASPNPMLKTLMTQLQQPDAHIVVAAPDQFSTALSDALAASILEWVAGEPLPELLAQLDARK